jgi:hypothetical protein
MAANRKQIASVVWNAIGLLIAAVVLGTLVLWLLPAVLTRHPSSGMTVAEQLKAVNDVRAPLVAFLVAVGAAGTLWFTGRTYRLNREGHVTDRYTKAVGQLGDGSPAVRIGGVYALERIGNDSPKDRTTIIYVEVTPRWSSACAWPPAGCGWPPTWPYRPPPRAWCCSPTGAAAAG